MVSACAGCNRMQPWASSFTGIGSALIYLALSRLMLRLRIDDPLDAFAVHFGGGLWGLISAPIIVEDGIAYAIGNTIGGADSIVIAKSFVVRYLVIETRRISISFTATCMESNSRICHHHLVVGNYDSDIFDFEKV